MSNSQSVSQSVSPGVFAKIWREIKRPFGKWIYSNDSFCKDVFRHVMSSPKLCKEIYDEEIAKRIAGKLNLFDSNIFPYSTWQDSFYQHSRENI